jgi:hypothetical protein
VQPLDGLERLGSAQVASLLTVTRDHIIAELEALGDRWASWSPAPGEWSANECVGHIIEADRRGFAGRIRRILAEDGVAESGWDQVATAAARRDRERSVAEMIAELRAVRDDAIDLIRSLGPADLERFAVHAAVGRLTVSNVLNEWVFHDRNHIRQLLANTQARAWPGMGNARRFSHPDR